MHSLVHQISESVQTLRVKYHNDQSWRHLVLSQISRQPLPWQGILWHTLWLVRWCRHLDRIGNGRALSGEREIKTLGKQLFRPYSKSTNIKLINLFNVGAFEIKLCIITINFHFQVIAFQYCIQTLTRHL